MTARTQTVANAVDTEQVHVIGGAVTPDVVQAYLSGRGRKVPKDLSDRWHLCPYEDCGLSLQRDHNAARTILNRAGLARVVVPQTVVSAAESHVL